MNKTMGWRWVWAVSAVFVVACGGAGGVELGESQGEQLVASEDGETMQATSSSSSGCNGPSSSSSSSSSGGSSSYSGSSSSSGSSSGATASSCNACQSYVNACKTNPNAQAPCYCASACYYACNGQTANAHAEAQKARQLGGSCPY